MSGLLTAAAITAFVVAVLISVVVFAVLYGQSIGERVANSLEAKRLANDLQPLVDENLPDPSRSVPYREALEERLSDFGIARAAEAQRQAGRGQQLSSFDAQRAAAEQPQSAQAAEAPQPGFKPLSLREAMPLIDSAHHVAVLGGTGDGKTWTGNAIMRLLPPDELICVIDPNWEPGKWGNLPVVTTDENDGFAPILAALYGLQREWKDRKARTWDPSKGDRGPRLNIFWDEVNETMEELPDAGVFLRRWLRRVRYLRGKLFIFPQSDRVEALGIAGHGDARKNILWIYLGSDAREKAEWLFSKKRMSSEMLAYICSIKRPCLINWQSGFYCVSLEEVPDILQRPIENAELRAFVPKGVVSKQDLNDDDLDIGDESEQRAMINDLTEARRKEVDNRMAQLAQVDWVAHAAEVLDGVVTETDKIFTLAQVKPGGSPVYVEARRLLRTAMERIVAERKLQNVTE